MNLDELVCIRWAINTQTVLSYTVLRNIRQYIGVANRRIRDVCRNRIVLVGGAFKKLAIDLGSTSPGITMKEATEDHGSIFVREEVRERAQPSEAWNPLTTRCR